MRLSSESKIILDKLQNDIYSKQGYEVSYSSIVSQAVRQFVPKKDSVDWKELKETTLKFSSLEQSNNWEYQTLFEAKRIHRAFCVRLCLKAQFLSNNDS